MVVEVKGGKKKVLVPRRMHSHGTDSPEGQISYDDLIHKPNFSKNLFDLDNIVHNHRPGSKEGQISYHSLTDRLDWKTMSKHYHTNDSGGRISLTHINGFNAMSIPLRRPHPWLFDGNISYTLIPQYFELKGYNPQAIFIARPKNASSPITGYFHSSFATYKEYDRFNDDAKYATLNEFQLNVVPVPLLGFGIIADYISNSNSFKYKFLFDIYGTGMRTGLDYCQVGKPYEASVTVTNCPFQKNVIPKIDKMYKRGIFEYYRTQSDSYLDVRTSIDMYNANKNIPSVVNILPRINNVICITSDEITGFPVNPMRGHQIRFDISMLNISRNPFFDGINPEGSSDRYHTNETDATVSISFEFYPHKFNPTVTNSGDGISIMYLRAKLTR